MTAAATDLPRREPGIQLRRDRDHCVLIDDGDAELCTLNDTAAAIWELCDGLTTVGEMVSAICTITGAEPQTVTRDVGGVLTKLERLSAIDWVQLC